jgi:hypothetical protein
MRWGRDSQEPAAWPDKKGMAMNKRTKRLGIGGVIAGGLMLGAAGLVIAAGIAKADSDYPLYGHEGDRDVAAFASELYPFGVYLSAPQASQVAKNICGEEAEGYTRAQEEEVTEQAHYSIGYSVYAVMGAEWHFCPQFDSLHVPSGPEAPPPGPPVSAPQPSQPEPPTQEWQPDTPMTLAGASYSTTSPFPSSPCDYVNVDGQCEQGPNQNPGNFKCCDGTNSHATHRNGACSHHGGICG